ncbi:MAG: hypothetical protein Q9182_004464 [Xanthomendoza sp. 2 TL-2023]
MASTSVGPSSFSTETEEARVSTNARKNVILTDPLERFPDLQPDLNYYDGYPPALNFLPSAGLTNRLPSCFLECRETSESVERDVTTTTFNPDARFSYANGPIAHGYYPTGFGQDELVASHSEMWDVHGRYCKFKDSNDEYDQDTLRPGSCISAPGSRADIPDVYARSHRHPIFKTSEQWHSPDLISDATFESPLNNRCYPKNEDFPAITAASTNECYGPPTLPWNYMPAGPNSPLTAPLSHEPSFHPAPFGHLYGPDLYPNIPHHRKPTTNPDLQERVPIYPSHLNHAGNTLTNNAYAQIHGYHQHTDANTHPRTRTFINRNPNRLNHHQESRDGELCIDIDTDATISNHTYPIPTHAQTPTRNIRALETYHAQQFIHSSRYRPIGHPITHPATNASSSAKIPPQFQKQTLPSPFTRDARGEREEYGRSWFLPRDDDGAVLLSRRYMRFRDEENGGVPKLRNMHTSTSLKRIVPWILVLGFFVFAVLVYRWVDSKEGDEVFPRLDPGAPDF